jgi:nitrate reductase NapE component
VAEEVAYVVVGVAAAVGLFTAVSTATLDHPLIPTNDHGESWQPSPLAKDTPSNDQKSGSNQTNPESGLRDQVKLVLPAVYNRPTDLTFDETTEISLIIETVPDQNVAAETLGLKGKLTPVQLHLSDKVSAALSGDDLEVKLRGADPTRVITEFGPVQWIWDVKPEKTGNTLLTLEVFALLDGGNNTVKVRTFRDRIPITATVSQRVQAYVAFLSPIWTLVASVVGGIGGLMIWLWQIKVGPPAPVNRTPRNRNKPKSTITLPVEQQKLLDETVRKTFAQHWRRQKKD